MKKITLLLIAVLSCWQINAQVSSYSFAAGTGGVLDLMTGSTQLIASASDDGVSAVTGIGFTFNFAGVDYTQFSVNANGNVRLGATEVTSQWVNTAANADLTSPLIMAYWDDLATGSVAGGGNVTYKLTGTAPNQKLIIEWFVTIPRNTGGPANAKFQCVLEETTNVITFVYGTGMVANPDNSGYTIGLATSATLFNTVDATANTVSQAVFKTDNTVAIPSGTTYTWTPPTCPGSTGLTVNSVSTDEATVTWTPPTSVPTNGYEYVITSTQGEPSGAGTATTANTASATSLTSNTVYYVYVRSNCGSSFGNWVAVGTFTTLCDPFGDFTENFDATSTGVLPNCWSSIKNSTSIYSYVQVSFNWTAQSNSVELYNSDDVNAELFLVTPSLTDLPNGTHRLKFKVSGGTDYPLFIGTMSDPTNPTTFNAMEQVLTSGNGFDEYVINFSNTTTDTYIAFQHGLGGTYRSIYIDDVVWQPIPSCIEPTLLGASNITVNSAELSWTEMGSATSWNIEYGPSGFTQGTGTVVSGVTNSYVLPGLTDNTEYDYYVQADCGSTDGVSYWVGPYTFTTSCNPFGDFTEGFESTASGEITNCWSSYVNATSQYAAVDVVTWNGYNSSNSVELYNSDDANAELYLITPNLTDLPNGTHRLKFRMSGGTGYTLFVGTMSDPTNNATFTEVEPLQAPDGFNEYIIDFSGVSTTDGYIAFKHGLGGTYRTIYIDNVVWEPVPSTAPACASNVVATPDAACGNFANLIEWDTTLGADGYYLTIGTTTGGTDVLNNENIGNITSYSFVGDFNTTYYYTLVPFNSFGSATGCTEQSFTTFATGCYCVSDPISVDNSGITNVQLGTTDFPNGPVTYFDHTATTVTLQQGLNTNVQVSFATGYTYNTYIWIDFNDNLTFEASEIVYSGESSSVNPTILNASFVMPATATLGTHRMRLAAADYMPTADPCYSGYYGVTLDFSVDIVVPSCTPASATATVSADCANNQYFVAVDVTALGSGTPSISDGTNTWPVTATGVVQAGPFASGSSVTLTVLHGSDSTCDLPLGTFNYACPPANDDLCNAIALTLNAAVTGTDYSLSAATGQTSEPVPSCFNGGINGSVWFSFIAPASGSVDVTTDFAGGSLSGGDTEIAVYDATGVTCSDLTTLGASIGCDQDGGTTVNYSSFLPLTGLTAGNTYYIQVDRYGGTTAGTFGIQVNTTLSADSFDNTSFAAYPNPVKDVLNLSYSTEITSVKVINLLGQEVLSRNVGSTSTQVDMSNLTAGAYIVNVTVDNVVKSIKVIKQ